jgi:hypothetical protein
MYGDSKYTSSLKKKSYDARIHKQAGPTVYTIWITIVCPYACSVSFTYVVLQNAGEEPVANTSVKKKITFVPLDVTPINTVT